MCFSQHISLLNTTPAALSVNIIPDVQTLQCSVRGFIFSWHTSSDCSLPLSCVYHIGMDLFYFSKPIKVKTSTCSPSPFTPMFYLILLVRVSSLWQTLQTHFVATFSLLTSLFLILHLSSCAFIQPKHPSSFQAELVSSCCNFFHGSYWNVLLDLPPLSQSTLEYCHMIPSALTCEKNACSLLVLYLL